jgi:hypothetical protein
MPSFMRGVRSVGAVVFGYMLFAMSTFAFFKLAGVAPHQDAALANMASSIAVGVIAALMGGYSAAWLAGRRPLAHGIAVAIVLALGATVSLFKTIGHGAVWSQSAALLLMVPGAVLGGLVRAKQLSHH